MIAISEAARQSGVSVETIRYYEREGIIGPVGRTGAGRRSFTRAEVAALRFIRRCRDLGFSIADARALRAFSDSPEGSCHQVERVARRQLEAVRTKIAELRMLERALAELAGNCSQGKPDCPMLAALLADRDDSGDPSSAPGH